MALSEFAELAGLAVVNAEARAQLAVRASNDPLTGLANHRTFHEQLAAETERARRHGRDLALALFDLDHFKPINDRYGHQTGDQVLVETARRLAECVRPGDVIARVGGEEFAWLLPECDAFDAWEAAERARRAISEAAFAVVGRITISGGVCELAQARDAADLYRLADGALYWAKAHGRDVCFRYAPEIGEALAGREQTERLEHQQALTSVRVLARVVDAKEPATRRHSERVAELAVRLATVLGWPARAMRPAPRGRAPARRRQDRRPRPHPPVARPPSRPSSRQVVETHATLGAQMLEDVIGGEQVVVGPRPPRALRRHRLSGRPGRRGHSGRRPHPRGGRGLRRDDHGARSCAGTLVGGDRRGVRGRGGAPIRSRGRRGSGSSARQRSPVVGGRPGLTSPGADPRRPPGVRRYRHPMGLRRIGAAFAILALAADRRSGRARAADGDPVRRRRAPGRGRSHRMVVRQRHGSGSGVLRGRRPRRRPSRATPRRRSSSSICPGVRSTRSPPPVPSTALRPPTAPTCASDPTGSGRRARASPACGSTCPPESRCSADPPVRCRSI